MAAWRNMATREKKSESMYDGNIAYRQARYRAGAARLSGAA